MKSDPLLKSQENISESANAVFRKSAGAEEAFFKVACVQANYKSLEFKQSEQDVENSSERSRFSQEPSDDEISKGAYETHNSEMDTSNNNEDHEEQKMSDEDNEKPSSNIVVTRKVAQKLGIRVIDVNKK